MTEQHLRVAEANALLAVNRELDARWWYYTASLSTFELLVGDPTGSANLVLVLPSCSFLSGPVNWSNQRLVVSIAEPTVASDNAQIEVRDDSVHFIARGRMFTYKKNLNLLENGSVMFPNNRRSSEA